MRAYETPGPSEPSLARGLSHAGRYYLSSPRGLLVLGGTVVAAGPALSWSWLVSAGVAPVLLSVLPCAVMCALGLCMNRFVGSSCSVEKDTVDRETLPATPDRHDHGSS